MTERGSGRRGVWRRRSQSGLALLLLPLLGATPPALMEIEIVPSSVFVLHDRSATTFELEARLWSGTPGHRTSILESDGYTLNWTSSETWLKVTSRGGFRAQVTIDQPKQGTAIVTVEAGGKTSPGTIIVVATAPTGQDFLTAVYTPDQPPDVAVTNGIRGSPGAPCEVAVAAFVGGIDLGDIVAPCAGADGAWDVAVLSRGRRMVFAPASWTPQSNSVNTTALQGAARTVPVAVRVMVGDDALSADELETLRKSTMEMALAEVAAANGMLTANRAGVQLGKPDTATIIPSASEVDAESHVVLAECDAADGATSAHDAQDMLNIYYVNSTPGTRGYTCPWHTWRKQPAIFIEIHEVLQTTLAHELGHALGVTLPRQGHTDVVGGLDITNVMTRGYDDTDPGGRRRLTVGQVFRMNSDSASWLSWATAGAGVLVREAAQPRLACQCGVADAAGRCPRVADDVARSSAAPDGTDPWDCFDLLKIKNAPAFEHPVAIMAGRSWRVPPAGCSAALPGWEANHWYGIFVGVGNVTRRGDCETSAVVFFRRHRPIFADLTQSYHSQTQVADQMVVYNLLTKPLEVRVRLYGPPLSALLFTDDVNYARTVFGPANRSGIALVFVNGGTTCPPGVPNLPDLVVCYAPWMPFEGTLDGQGRIRVGKSGVTTLAHLIGRALGLEPLAAATPGYPLNIMHSAPADRGRKLTLGQVYRINARLGVLSGCNPTPCPPQDMDVGP